jgi:hypothetical protein
MISEAADQQINHEGATPIRDNSGGRAGGEPASHHEVANVEDDR